MKFNFFRRPKDSFSETAEKYLREHGDIGPDTIPSLLVHEVAETIAEVK